jgi:hypothetical protein
MTEPKSQSEWSECVMKTHEVMDALDISKTKVEGKTYSSQTIAQTNSTNAVRLNDHLDVLFALAHIAQAIYEIDDKAINKIPDLEKVVNNFMKEIKRDPDLTHSDFKYCTCTRPLLPFGLMQEEQIKCAVAVQKIDSDEEVLIAFMGSKGPRDFLSDADIRNKEFYN